MIFKKKLFIYIFKVKKFHATSFLHVSSVLVLLLRFPVLCFPAPAGQHKCILNVLFLFKETDSKWRMVVGNLRLGASLHVGMLLKGDRPPVTFSLIKVLRLPLFWRVYLCRAVLTLRGRSLQSL